MKLSLVWYIHLFIVILPLPPPDFYPACNGSTGKTERLLLQQVTTATDPLLTSFVVSTHKIKINGTNAISERQRYLIGLLLCCTVNNKSQCWKRDLPFCDQPDLLKAGVPEPVVSMAALSASQNCRQESTGLQIKRSSWKRRALHIWTSFPLVACTAASTLSLLLSLKDKEEKTCCDKAKTMNYPGNVFYRTIH